MTRLAIVSDIHCNIAGLERALELMAPFDELWCAGDSVFQFRWSNEVVRLLRDSGAKFLGEVGHRREITLPVNINPIPQLARAHAGRLRVKPSGLETKSQLGEAEADDRSRYRRSGRARLIRGTCHPGLFAA